MCWLYTFMTPFLYCNIWSVFTTLNYDDFYYIHRVFHYDSLNSGIVDFDPALIHIPEFLISNLHLLHDVDYDFINENTIPILKREVLSWKIDLTHYENIKLQSV